MGHGIALTAFILIAVYLASECKAKAVFAHYLVVGSTYQSHAQQDIDDAVAIGLDGFALDIGFPNETYVSNTLKDLFDHAATKGFKLFVSIDASELCAAAYAMGVNCGDSLLDYDNLFQRYLEHPAYYRGPDGSPMISSFSSGGLVIDQWQALKNSLNTSIYWIPDFDDTQGYYEADPGWYAYWGELVNGLFSWEAAWPYRAGYGGAYPGDVSPDLGVLNGTKQHNKTYMIALSPLQYKDAYNTNLYRPGELNLAVRMRNILSMSPQPDFVEIVTWNDGPESHYIGTIWPEQNNDTQGTVYATQAKAPHNAWQQIIAPFIAAWKNSSTPASMTPLLTSPAVPATGSVWYKTILQNATCTNNVDGYYGEKPDGFDSGHDALNWAISVPADSKGLRVIATSNGQAFPPTSLRPGLNYGAFENVQAGRQALYLLDGTGEVVMAAVGGPEVEIGCPDGIYDMNYQVVGLEAVGAAECPCCSSSYASGELRRV
ncbi:hypothetical protein ACLMJK_003147 [Lecanora helva]